MKIEKLILNFAITFYILVLSTPLTLQAQQLTQNFDTTPAEHPALNSELNIENGWWYSLSKERKMYYTIMSSTVLCGLWGFATWDYGSSELHSSNEDWFATDTRYGGADKLGHFWTTYAFSDALTSIYKSYGYGSRKASNYGALSAWAVQAVMEFGDATSENYGFSWEDMIANTLGALSSILMDRYPDIDRKIDFRVEYIFNGGINGVFDDYSNLFYSIVLKLDGFDAIENTFLKYLEFHAGYYTRGFDTDEVSKKRDFYCGISVNFSKFFSQNGFKKTGKILEYFQLPYTVVKVSYELD